AALTAPTNPPTNPHRDHARCTFLSRLYPRPHSPRHGLAEVSLPGSWSLQPQPSSDGVGPPVAIDASLDCANASKALFSSNFAWMDLITARRRAVKRRNLFSHWSLGSGPCEWC